MLSNELAIAQFGIEEYTNQMQILDLYYL